MPATVFPVLLRFDPLSLHLCWIRIFFFFLGNRCWVRFDIFNWLINGVGTVGLGPLGSGCLHAIWHVRSKTRMMFPIISYCKDSSLVFRVSNPFNSIYFNNFIKTIVGQF